MFGRWWLWRFCKKKLSLPKKDILSHENANMSKCKIFNTFSTSPRVVGVSLKLPIELEKSASNHCHNRWNHHKTKSLPQSLPENLPFTRRHSRKSSVQLTRTTLLGICLYFPLENLVFVYEDNFIFLIHLPSYFFAITCSLGWEGHQGRRRQGSNPEQGTRMRRGWGLNHHNASQSSA